MSLKPDPKLCKERQLLVDEYVDNRMSEKEKTEYKKMLVECEELYSCTTCQDNIRIFTTIKSTCKQMLHIDQNVSNQILMNIKEELKNSYFNQ